MNICAKNKRWFGLFSSFLALLASSLALLLLSSCRPSEIKRPPGYIRVGKISELLADETFLADLGLLLRRDERGLYVMSTMCTHDLTLLSMKQVGNKRILVSVETPSSYSLEGDVLSGPATAALSYYELRFDKGEYDGPVDTLYANIGSSVSRNWRLALPSRSAP